nr:putative RNA-directed DNA polymerase, eukaryota, reverse transcriptase zinc-binding domain protein [Tanacetum cinerariifolium]
MVLDKMEIIRGCNACFVSIIPKGEDPLGLGDFRLISLIGCYYKIIAKLLAERVKRVASSMVGEVQNAFIKGRYILDGVLIANETMDFLREKKEKGLIFKVDFEKAYDSRRQKNSVWRGGVRHCDPLSPFLFILAGDGLNTIVTEAVEKGIFKGVFVGDDKVTVSHLQYADDTLFFGKWNKENAKYLMEMAEMARWMGCGIGEFPFAYLGLPIGENMRRIKAWGPVVEKFKNRLADWKAKTILFGGRLTLVKSKVLEKASFGEGKKLSWVKRNSVINSFGEGGLNIGSLRAKNLALLGKWWWRFKREGRILWVRVIKSIHGSSGSLGDGGIRVGIGTRKVVCGIRGCGKMMFGVGNGIGLETLERWMLGEDGKFTVKELSRLIEQKVLHVESGMHETLWNKLVPKKVNIFVWKALRGRLPVWVEVGEYSQWVERFMNYLKEQTDGEAMINSIKNGDQPLPRVTQVSIAGTSSTEQPPLKDKSMWHVIGSEYGEQDRKVAVLYECETFKVTEGELLLDTYIRYLQVINGLKKCGYSKDNCKLNFKFLNNLQPEWKQYATMMRQNKNLMDINIDALYNILKQNQRDVNDAMGSKKKIKVVVSSDSEGSEADDFSELKKITALLAKAFDRRKFYSKPTNNNLRTSSSYQSANKK